MFNFILPFLVAFLISILLTPLVRTLAIRSRQVAHPNAGRWHKKDTPVLGGIAIFLGFLIPYVIFAQHNMAFWAFALCGLGAFFVGLVDDLKHIRPYSKLIGQIIVASVLINFGFQIDVSNWPYLSIPLTIIWIAGIMNAFNLLDNMDGLCAGISFIASCAMLAYAMLSSNPELALIASILGGSTLGFLRYNFNPAKIFMGDCGSLFLGYAFATATLMGTYKEASNLFFTILVPSFVLAVPIFDTLLVTFTRKMSSRPISVGGRDHASHRLVALGLSERKAVLLLYTVAIICGSGAILYNVANKMLVVVLGTILVVGLLLFGMFLGGMQVYPEATLKVKLKKSNGIPVILNGFIYHKRRIAEVIIDFAIICVAYVSAYLLKFDGVISPENEKLLLASLPLVIPIKLSMFFAFGIYRGIWKYISLHDAVAIFKAVSSGTILSVAAIFLLLRSQGYPGALFVIDWMVLLLLASGTRVALRFFRDFFAFYSASGKPVFIIGAGDAGELLLREIRYNKGLGYIPVGFIDDDKKKLGKTIHGVPVLGTKHELLSLCKKKKVDEIIIAMPSVSDVHLADLFELCRKHNINFRHISSIMPIKRELL